jgi:hypothetical protein
MGNSFESILKATAKPKEKKEAVKSPLISDTPQDIREAVDAWIDTNEIAKSAGATLSFCAEKIISFVRQRQDADGFRRDFKNSYEVQGTDPGRKVKFVSTNRWSVNAADLETLSKVLGSRADQMLQQRHTVKLKDDVLKDPKLQADLMKRMGDAFEKFFDVILDVKVSENFDERIYELEPERIEHVRALAKQARPSLR